MYSGTTLTKYSGRILGAHQRLDRVARTHLDKIIPQGTVFPSAKQILQFEGRNGPDGIKIKSPAQDEPWHYYSPFDDDDSQLIKLITAHYKNLVDELKMGNKERTAFEAAWLAHALVDGLTPAHHYPYEEKLSELMGGQGIETRTSTKDKLVLPGRNRRQQVKNNWKMWGPKGLMSSHGFFELGVATILLPLKFGEAVPTKEDIDKMSELGIAEWFKRSAREIAVLDMYHTFNRRGWTPKLARQVRQKLGPLIVQTVTLAWYAALNDAGLIKKKK
jgi:hypothetical protein